MSRQDPHKPTRPHARRGTTSKPTAKDPGPAPLSPRQRELRAAMRGEPIPPPSGADPVRVTHRRDAAASRKRVPMANRRRPNYGAIVLSVLGVGAVSTGVGYLLMHPRFAVPATKYIAVKGNESITEVAVQDHFKPFVGKNLFLLPMDKVDKAARAEPTVEKAEVRRLWPNRLAVTVTERKPFASVQLPDGSCYTIDGTLVPFRKTETPEIALPRVLLSPSDQEIGAVTLGKPMKASGLAEVQKCLDWSEANPSFPVESIAIDPTGKLCLNRIGGMQVRLGSGRDLDRKLETLTFLMGRRPEVQAGVAVAYVNLFSSDAPAVMPRTPRTPPQKGPGGKGPGSTRNPAPADSAPSDART